MQIFRKKYHLPGTAPGTLIHVPDSNVDSKSLRIDVVNYGGKQIDFCTDIDIENCQSCINEKLITWVHICGPVEPTLLKKMGGLFDLHPLALEDVINHGQRPKVEFYDKQIFVIVNMPTIVNEEIIVEQVSIFCGDGYIISFHDQTNDDAYNILYKRLEKNTNNIRHFGSDYLLYVLLDLVVDSGFPTLENWAIN